VRFAFIDAHRAQWPVHVMCRVLRVSRAGYHAWRARAGRPTSARATRRRELLAHVRRAHEQSRGIYGSPRVHRQLRRDGVACCENTVARVMRDAGIRSRARRRFKPPRTTDSRHPLPVHRNVLARRFRQEEPDRAWCADFTCVATGEGWIYLAVVMDLCTRKIVGWSMADNMEDSLTLGALRMAIERRRPRPGGEVLHHSDRGVQYAAEEYEALLAAHGIACSMSRLGDCYDNACVESFFSSLKREWTHHHRYATRAEARGSLFEYVEVFYNRRRLHSTLDYLSPAEYEKSLS
jgi:transposase InsO family protein